MLGKPLLFTALRSPENVYPRNAALILSDFKDPTVEQQIIDCFCDSHFTENAAKLFQANQFCCIYRRVNSTAKQEEFIISLLKVNTVVVFEQDEEVGGLTIEAS
jgi:hypothetical protein